MQNENDGAQIICPKVSPVVSRLSQLANLWIRGIVGLVYAPYARLGWRVSLSLSLLLHSIRIIFLYGEGPHERVSRPYPLG